MNGVEQLKEKLERGERIYSTMLCEWNNTRLPEVYKSCGLDFILADLEHGAFYPESIGDMAQMCRIADIPLIARIQDCEYHCISKCIDMGADGILIPRTESMEQIETAIRSLRMPPYGKKGVGGRACMRAGETVAEFNKNRLLFLQIESPEGIDLLDEMLTKYGEQVAGVIVGPFDLTVAMGYPDFKTQRGEEYYDCIRKVIRVSRAHGKSSGIFMNNDSAIKTWHKEGMNIYWVGTEMSMMAAEARRIKKFITELE
ncbi:MAG: hypothetical protein J6B12_01335 [Clostridia bacterium]|nr:hypothetical protein [Clostridia bacterium]